MQIFPHRKEKETVMAAKKSAGTYTREQFATALLVKVNAPDTAENIDFLVAWGARENTQAAFNMLATEWELPSEIEVNGKEQATGYPDYFNETSPGHGVQNYHNLEDGVSATADTLAQHNIYPHIIPALVGGNPFAVMDTLKGDLLSWSGGGYGEIDHPSITAQLKEDNMRTLLVTRSDGSVFTVPEDQSHKHHVGDPAELASLISTQDYVVIPKGEWTDADIDSIPDAT